MTVLPAGGADDPEGWNTRATQGTATAPTPTSLEAHVIDWFSLCSEGDLGGSLNLGIFWEDLCLGYP